MLFLLAFTCFACGGGGGGGGASKLADLTSEIPILATSSLAGVAGDHAIVILEVLSDGTIHWSAAVPPALAPSVTGLTINRASDSSVLVDLLGTGTFDAATGAATGTATVLPSEAADLADNPADFVSTLLTSTGPPATGGFLVFTPAEWHTVLLGSNESPVADANAGGAATFRVASPTEIDYVIAMKQPLQADVTLAHIHAGDAGTNGLIVLDLNPAGAVRDAGAGTISGTVTVDGETLARIATNLSGFYCNVHTAAAPNGVARGQLDEGTVEMMAALLGSAETPTVIEAEARGGATIEFETFTSGRVLTAFQSAVEDIEDVILQHIHVGAAGTPGAILVNLMGADYITSLSSHSAESTFTYTQKDLTRILANPAGFYVNLHTTAGPNGTVRGQLSTAPRVAFADMNGAQVTPTPNPGATGTMRITFTGVHTCSYTIIMQSPPATDITAAYLRDGPAGQNGGSLIDLFSGGDMSVVGNTITGTAPVPGRTVARVLGGTPGGSALAGAALPSIFYGEVVTVAKPGGAARGQFVQISGGTPPAGLQYTSPVTYVTGAPITPNNPTSIGGPITSYSISPALSTGLSLSTATGVISGTPTQTRVLTNYTVTATNAAGSTQATVTITVNIGPPLTLTYATPVSYIQNTQITPNLPSSTGGQITSYGVSPALPTGLSLSTTTGVISGTPTAVAAAADYTVTGTNAAGSVQKKVNITVTSGVTAPSNLTYSSNPVSYPTGYAITNNTPTVSGTTPITFSAASLPAGLSIDSSTGVISGTPTTVTSAANYQVTATNSAGSTQVNVNIAITLGAPGSFTYSPSSTIIGYIGTPITSISPQHTGGGAVASYSISGTLLAGLSFSTSTGVISGTPTAKTPDSNGDGFPDTVSHTVTATNATGSTQTTIYVIGY